MEDLELRYPIGKAMEQPFSDGQKEEWLIEIQHCPRLLEHAVSNLDEHQLNTPGIHKNIHLTLAGFISKKIYERL